MKKMSIIVLSSILLGSCVVKTGSGNIISQTRETGSFKGISVSGGFEVELKNGPAEKVVVEADDNLVKYIDVKVTGNELKIRMDNISVSDAHLKVFITAPEINSIKASSASEVIVKDELRSNGTISLKASSAANITVNLDAPEVKADASSSGEIKVSGRTKDLRAESASGSTISAGNLLSENSFVQVSSGADAHVNASIIMDASASSGGNVRYRGSASVVKKSESSGGTVQKDN